MDYGKTAGELLTAVRKKHPLLHHITNYVVMNDNANIALHIGASPVMAHAPNEMEEMTGFANALVINIGTLEDAWIESMKLAAATANKRGIPILLDPVGAGATKLRTETVIMLLAKYKISVLKGNLGEVSSLAGLGGKVRGVDSEDGAPIVEAARKAAGKFGLTVAITGKDDVVSDGNKTLKVIGGSNWLATITGSGCNAATITGAFIAVGANMLTATACGLAAYGVAAEIAEKTAKGPASFKVAFFDAIYNLTPKQLEKGVNIQEV